MKLKNKKTGEIGNFCYGYTNELCVSWQKDDGFWGKQEYNSLAELNEEWCDYEEPEEYWHIAELCAGLQKKQDTDNGEDRFNKEIGNYFETEEEAEKAVEKLKAWKRLKDKGFRFRGWIRVHKKGSADITIASFIDEDYNITNDLELLFGGEE